MKDFLRLLTGRIAYERRARLLALQLAHDVGGLDYPLTLQVAAHFQCFLLTGESAL